MLHRIRANVRFTKSSGLATWCRDQMSVRYTQAVAINPGLDNEEQKVNEIETDRYPNHDVFRCDLPLSDEAYATDAYDTLSAASVFHTAYVSGFPEPDGTTPSYVEYHTCRHDENPPGDCAVVDRKDIA